MDPERLKPILEAALLASPQPLTPARLAELFDEIDRPGPDAIAQALHALAQDCDGRGIELVEVGSGFRYQVRGDVFPHISGLWTERQTRYSRALLETLSLIAYRQPITRGEIEQIRGVAVATSILRTLEEREWVRVVGHRDVPGRPALYGTTRAFLDYFQLRSLDELPPLSALRDLDTLEPELALDIDAPAASIEAAAATADSSGSGAPMPADEASVEPAQPPSTLDVAEPPAPQEGDSDAREVVAAPHVDADAGSGSHEDSIAPDRGSDDSQDTPVIDRTDDGSGFDSNDAGEGDDDTPASEDTEERHDDRERRAVTNDAAATAARD
jgi:segregation and condensation protein B